MEVKIVCPLGSECEKAVDANTIERCAWYVKLGGKNPQTGEVVDEWKCAMAWQPLLMVESTGVSAGVASSVQSLRNETIKRQDEALKLVQNQTKEVSDDISTMEGSIPVRLTD